MSAIIRRRGLIGSDDPILWLYKDGNQCTSITGGYTRKGYIHGYWSAFQLLSNRIYYLYDSNNSAVSLGTVNKIPFADYNYLKIHYITLSSSGWSVTWDAQGFISDKNGTNEDLSYFYSGSIFKTFTVNGNKTDYTLVCNIANVKSSAYLYLLRDSWSTVRSEISIDKIWLEK